MSYARPAQPELPAPPGWPDPPAPAAWQGLAGQIVETIAPHTEADPVAILAQLLVAAGATVGRGAWVAVEATRHHPNQFAVIVGESAKARKGSSWDQVAALMTKADPSFATRTSTGLSSGEGLIWALGDPSGADPGTKDPRLLVVEAEFASVLKAIARDINTLSPVLRSAWDGRPLALLTRTAPAGPARPTSPSSVTSPPRSYYITPTASRSPTVCSTGSSSSPPAGPACCPKEATPTPRPGPA